MKRLIPAVLGVVVACALAPAAFAQTTAPGLGGTAFDDTTPSVTSGNCASYTYEASGPATGSYAGTFTETGTVAMGVPDAMDRRPITSLNVSFEINSPAGHVVGTRTYVPGTSTGNVRCEETWDGLLVGTSAQNVRWNATIDLPDGRTCTAQGGSLFTHIVNNPVIADQYDVSFTNDLSNPTAVCDDGGEEPPPPPLEPTSKDDCRNGGWATYGFKNQGECIAWVVKHGG
jgi:hypothetical protein